MTVSASAVMECRWRSGRVDRSRLTVPDHRSPRFAFWIATKAATVLPVARDGNADAEKPLGDEPPVQKPGVVDDHVLPHHAACNALGDAPIRDTPLMAEYQYPDSGMIPGRDCWIARCGETTIRDQYAAIRQMSRLAHGKSGNLTIPDWTPNEASPRLYDSI